MGDKGKLISIITVNFNNRRALYNTIKSVFTQNCSAFEYIIIDGGSTDGSKDIIEEYAEKIDYWVSERDSGIYHAMNKAIRKATGEYLMFLNSGDCLSEAGALQKCLDAIVQEPGADIYYGDMFLVNAANQPERLHCRHPHPLTLEYFKKDTINHQSSLIRASLFAEYGHYPETYKLASDYWLYLKCFLDNRRFQHIPFPLVEYDFSGASSVNQELYQKEKNAIWSSLVPPYVQSLLAETEGYRQLKEYKLVKAAIWLNNNYQALKKK